MVVRAPAHTALLYDLLYMDYAAYSVTKLRAYYPSSCRALAEWLWSLTSFLLNGCFPAAPLGEFKAVVASDGHA